ncbi:MAG: ABC transporter permease subunit [Gemmatimonadota bacterium]
MWKSIFLFEIKYQLRQPLFYLVTLFFSILVFMSGTRDGVGSAFGRVSLNAPLVTMDLLTRGSIIGLFAVIAFVASAAVRDFDRRTSELFFSKPVSRFDYLTGRFAGSIVISLLMYVIGALTLAISSFMPWLDPELVGPFMVAPYVFTLGVLILPTLFCLGATFFALASWTRSILVTYLGVVGFFAVNLFSRMMASDLENEAVGQMLDPFGVEALRGAVRYWTIAERNTAIPEIGGVLLYNRLLWVGVGLLVLGLGVVTFDPSRSRSRRKKRREETKQVAPRGAAGGVSRPAASQVFTRATVLTQFLRQTRLEVVSVFKSVPFIGMLAFGLFIVVGGANSIGREVGTDVYPLTHLMLQAIQSGYAILLVIIATLYSGDMIWKERSLGVSEVYDAAPTPNAVYLGAKLTALVLAMAAFLLCGVAATIGFQVWRGYYDFELGLYAKGAATLLVYPALMVFLAGFFQIVSRSKFVGYALMIVFMLSWDLIEEFGFEHHLYRFASVPPTPYSEMNGYGHFLTPFLWYSLYWAFFCAVLLGLSIVFWNRGIDTAWKLRWTEARARFRGPARALVAAGAMGFVATGSWIFYNTNLLNEYVPSDEAQERQAAYEKEYRQYKDGALPRIQAVQADVDIFPGERRVEIRGIYRMENEGSEPIRHLHFNLSNQVRVNRLDLPPHQAEVEDDELGYYVYRLDQPLEPGEAAEFGFDLTVEQRGFVNHGPNTSIVANGTFFDNRAYFPVLGYTDRKQLVDRSARRKHGLEPVHRFAKIDDDFARRNTYVGVDADWVDFETTVSTSADQIAIAPGSLQSEWTEGGRRYFHYKMDRPILHFFGYMSGRYEVVRDTWNGVAIEIYHHPGHEYNVARMIDAVKKSLDYFTANFSPYQHRQVRIIEIPRYAAFGARAFPNTIPFSEAAGFIARLDDEDAFDVPFRRTSHEVAHQWWAHQVVGGNVQGATMLSETMAQYSSLMVLEKEYGPEKTRRFLKYELDRYLGDRGRELVEEMPLSLVENQPYIHYSKGSVIMYALKDYLGEEPLNRAIAEFVSKVAFQEPPFTTTREFLDEVRRVAPEGSERLIEDLFETVTLFDNKVAEATYTERPDGTFLVRLEVEAKKLRADGEGIETEIPIDDWVDIAVLGEQEIDGETDDKVLFFEKRRIADGQVVFELVVDERPVRVGFDPYNRLIDRNSDDNLREVSRSQDTK